MNSPFTNLDRLMLDEINLARRDPKEYSKKLKNLLHLITRFVIFVNDKELMHFSYTRYIENQIRETFGFKGTPLHFIIRERGEEK